MTITEEGHGIEMAGKRLSIVVNLIGRMEKGINGFNGIVEELKRLSEGDWEIVFVVDGIQWTSLPLYQMLFSLFPDSKYVVNEKECHLPAVLYNKGVESAAGEYITFFNLYTRETKKRIDMFLDFIDKNGNEDNLLYLRSDHDSPVFPSDQNRYGFLQIKNYYLLDDCFIRKECIDKLGKFNESPILQNEYDREFLLRASMYVSFVEIGNIFARTEKKIIYKEYMKVPNDITKRYLVRCNRPAFPNTTDEEINQDFVNDLNSSDYRKIAKYCKVLPQCNLPYHNKYKILILGGYWEYHHNQICFLDYLENLVGKGFATYYTAFDFSANEEDMDGNDLVIFTRCRSDRMLELIDYCRKKEIATIYMIDDNWMSIAKDYPAQGAIFVPGNPNYDNFIDAIGKCRTTWLFSDKLMEDLDGYARDFTKFRISVEPRIFETENRREKSDMLYIGFAGSLRWDDTAFRALARVANKYKNIKVVLVGNISPEQERLFRNQESIIKFGFMSYFMYARCVSELSPDLLIAPLSFTRTDASKCYNKYIESGIVQAACLYSKVEPYTQVVTEGVNGFFVDDEDENTWFSKLEEIVKDIPKLRNVQENVYRDIIENHTVEAVLVEFVEKIISVVEEKNDV